MKCVVIRQLVLAINSLMRSGFAKTVAIANLRLAKVLSRKKHMINGKLIIFNTDEQILFINTICPNSGL